MCTQSQTLTKCIISVHPRLPRRAARWLAQKHAFSSGRRASGSTRRQVARYVTSCPPPAVRERLKIWVCGTQGCLAKPTSASLRTTRRASSVSPRSLNASWNPNALQHSVLNIQCNMCVSFLCWVDLAAIIEVCIGQGGGWDSRPQIARAALGGWGLFLHD